MQRRSSLQGSVGVADAQEAPVVDVTNVEGEHAEVHTYIHTYIHTHIYTNTCSFDTMRVLSSSFFIREIASYSLSICLAIATGGRCRSENEHEQ
jgi:hypothetical protein